MCSHQISRKENAMRTTFTQLTLGLPDLLDPYLQWILDNDPELEQFQTSNKAWNNRDRESHSPTTYHLEIALIDRFLGL
jgi:hypothetical protein